MKRKSRTTLQRKWKSSGRRQRKISRPEHCDLGLRRKSDATSRYLEHAKIDCASAFTILLESDRQLETFESCTGIDDDVNKHWKFPVSLSMPSMFEMPAWASGFAGTMHTSHNLEQLSYRELYPMLLRLLRLIWFSNCWISTSRGPLRLFDHHETIRVLLCNGCGTELLLHVFFLKAHLFLDYSHLILCSTTLLILPSLCFKSTLDIKIFRLDRMQSSHSWTFLNLVVP